MFRNSDEKEIPNLTFVAIEPSIVHFLIVVSRQPAFPWTFVVNWKAASDWNERMF